MRYNLQELVRKGGTDTVRFTVSQLDGFTSDNDGFTPVFPIEVTAVFRQVGDSILLNVSFSAEVKVVCDRCLSDFTITVDCHDDYTVTDADNGEIYNVISVNNGVELDPLVWEAICLQIPYVKICGEDCPGFDFIHS